MRYLKSHTNRKLHPGGPAPLVLTGYVDLNHVTDAPNIVLNKISGTRNCADLLTKPPGGAGLPRTR